MTVYDIGQTRPYEGPDWAMEWVDKAQETFGEWRSYKEEKLDAYYREKLPNLGSFLLEEQDADFSGFDIEDNGDGTYTFTKSYLEKDTEGGTEIDINGNHVPAYKEVLDPTTSVTVDQAEKEAFDEEMLRMATLGGYGDYHHIYGVSDAEEAEKLEALAAEYGLSLRSGQVTRFAGDDSDEGLNRSLGQAVGSGDIYRQAPEFDHYSTFQSGSFQSAANIPLGDCRKLYTYLCSTAYNEMVDGREVGGFTVREDEQNKPDIKQFRMDVPHDGKADAIERILNETGFDRCMAFCNTKGSTERITKFLQMRGIDAECIHGDIPQRKREQVMDKFRQGKLRVFVSTDVAARGIDVDDVDIVFNCDVPDENQDYVHRIGRTGRAKRQGVAVTFVSDYPAKMRIDDIAEKTRNEIVPVKFDENGHLTTA